MRRALILLLLTLFPWGASTFLNALGVRVELERLLFDPEVPAPPKDGALSNLPPPPDWDDAAYLRAYPDVAAVVRSGDLIDGYEHYLRFGAKEGRKPGVRPSRAHKGDHRSDQGDNSSRAEIAAASPPPGAPPTSTPATTAPAPSPEPPAEPPAEPRPQASPPVESAPPTPAPPPSPPMVTAEPPPPISTPSPAPKAEAGMRAEVDAPPTAQSPPAQAPPPPPPPPPRKPPVGEAVRAPSAPTPTTTGAPAIREVRFGRHPTFVRMVLEVSAPISISHALSPDHRRLTINLGRVDWRAPRRWSGSADFPLDSYELATDDPSGNRLIVKARQPIHVLRTAVLPPDGGRGHRVMLDLAP